VLLYLPRKQAKREFDAASAWLVALPEMWSNTLLVRLRRRSQQVDATPSGI